MSDTEIHEGETLVLKTGATVVVRKVHEGQVWIRRPDGKFPRAVSLEWLLKVAAARPHEHPAWVKVCDHPGCVLTSDHTHGGPLAGLTAAWDREAARVRATMGDQRPERI